MRVGHWKIPPANAAVLMPTEPHPVDSFSAVLLELQHCQGEEKLCHLDLMRSQEVSIPVLKKDITVILYHSTEISDLN